MKGLNEVAAEARKLKKRPIKDEWEAMVMITAPGSFGMTCLFLAGMASGADTFLAAGATLTLAVLSGLLAVVTFRIAKAGDYYRIIMDHHRRLNPDAYGESRRHEILTRGKGWKMTEPDIEELLP